ncbi:phosphate starvation-inducible protein PhoH [Paraburkholderia sp. WSM4179]|nr:phosphate starvation-inducible protein PhoH [Paraburkholderia sp. WSM4179]
MALAELDFIERRQAVHFLGPPGTGKSHLCIALGVEAVRAGKSVYFGTLAEIVASMMKAEREGNLAQRVRFLAWRQICHERRTQGSLDGVRSMKSWAMARPAGLDAGTTHCVSSFRRDSQTYVGMMDKSTLQGLD